MWFIVALYVDLEKLFRWLIVVAERKSGFFVKVKDGEKFDRAGEKEIPIRSLHDGDSIMKPHKESSKATQPAGNGGEECLPANPGNGSMADDNIAMINRLRESEENFRALAEACPYGILIYQNEYWVYVNPAGQDITGYSAEELFRMKFWEIVDPEHREIARDRGLRREAGEYVIPSYDLKIRTKNGHARWISLTTTTCTFNGKTAGMLIAADITKDRERREELWESEQKYRTIINNIDEGYYEIDLDGSLTFFNESTCRIVGRPAQELHGLNYREYTGEEDARRLYSIFREVYETGRPARSIDLGFYRPDGERRHVEVSATLIRNRSGELMGFRGLVRDITDRKQAEAEKAKLEAQLMHAHKMEAVGTLAGGIAHDFNNILQAINGYAQILLMNKKPDDPDYERLIHLEKAGERASGLIQQLLTFSRKVEGEHRPISLNEEIRSVRKLLEQTLPKMIDIRLELESGLWFVKADPMHMEQILLNLACNAADAMPGGGRLTVGTKNVVFDEEYCRGHLDATPGQYVLMTVSDTGAGMDPETLKHIFDPFYTTKEAGKGTGLGLASVYGIVKGHGGRIQCYSEPGQGAVFRIYLPATHKTMEACAEKKSAQNAPATGGNECILVVDDEPTVREMAGEMLGHFGYRIFEAESGEHAIEVFRDNPGAIDLVILDLNMPGMGGYKCLQELLSICPEIKVLIASGYATDQHARQALSAGAVSFIGKPYHLREIAQKVRGALDGPDGAAPH